MMSVTITRSTVKGVAELTHHELLVIAVLYGGIAACNHKLHPALDKIFNEMSKDLLYWEYAKQRDAAEEFARINFKDLTK